MNITRRILLIVVVLALSSLSRIEAQVVSYTDEAAYLAALTAQSVPTLREGFEDDAVWGGVRTTIVGGPMTAPSIHSLGLTWTGNIPSTEITTGLGAALSGAYGLFQLPHGDPVAGLNDGWVATGDTPLVAIGGWIRTNTPFAAVALFLDGVEVNFTGSTAIGTGAEFFGAIAPAGFSSFEFRETEAMPGDWKLIFADDFTFAFGGTLIDCNQNGVGDALDIASGFSADCDLDSIPDECEIDANSGAPGGPYFCQTGCETDCNANGVLDACELVQPTIYASGQLGPIGQGSPQSFLIPSPATPMADVLIDFSAYANLAGPDEYLDIELNGAPVGRVFEYDGEDCPEPTLTETLLVIPRQTFINLVGTGSALFDLVPSVEIDANDCDQPSQIAVEVTIFTPSSLDGNANGVLDECEPGVWPSVCSGDGGDQTGCTDCPCMNNAPQGTIGGCLNSAGTSTRLLASGTDSISAADLRFEASGAPPNNSAVLTSGSALAPANAANPCFGLDSGVTSMSLDGLRCAVQGVLRHGVRPSDVNGDIGVTTNGWGAPSGFFNFNAFTAGATKHFQIIHRDDAAAVCMTGQNTSQAVSVAFTL